MDYDLWFLEGRGKEKGEERGGEKKGGEARRGGDRASSRALSNLMM